MTVILADSLPSRAGQKTLVAAAHQLSRRGDSKPSHFAPWRSSCWQEAAPQANIPILQPTVVLILTEVDSFTADVMDGSIQPFFFFFFQGSPRYDDYVISGSAGLIRLPRRGLTGFPLLKRSGRFLGFLRDPPNRP